MSDGRGQGREAHFGCTHFETKTRLDGGQELGLHDLVKDPHELQNRARPSGQGMAKIGCTQARVAAALAELRTRLTCLKVE